jgi:hypothetical protein
MKIRLSQFANEDLADGYTFYEEQEKGIGRYFLNSLYADLELLKTTAGTHPLYITTFHRMLSRRFPFAIYYKIDGNIVDVYAVADCRRDPAWLRSTLLN